MVILMSKKYLQLYAQNLVNLTYTVMVVITEDETILLRVQSYKTMKYDTWRSRFLTILTHLSQMNFPIPINSTSLFQILGVFGGIFHLYLIFVRFFVSKQ